MKQYRGKRQKRKSDRLTTIILVCIFFAGVIILAYPSVSNWWNGQVTTRAVENYEAAIAAMQETDYTSYFEAAQAYNETLAKIGSAKTITSPDLVDEDYWDLLDVSGTGVMGYVTIDKINVQLPIYHGTDAGVLQIAAGHLEGTSLPVGGESTHCVISAHRGLPSALLFTNLDQLEVGDTFTITVLNQVMTYEVDQISIVLPDELENLYIEEGKDYCTLMTCTPYGVNSHRLLVRGVRVENATQTLIHVTAEAYKVAPLLVAPVLAVPLVVILLIWLMVTTRKGRKPRKAARKRQSVHEWETQSNRFDNPVKHGGNDDEI
ncbi:MAG: class C sortase [Lachnospiraceae bacterium]|nr:class C sortase [Lachnospiraceae bacterium]